MDDNEQLTSHADKAQSLLDAIQREEYERIISRITSLPDKALDTSLKNLASENAELSARLRIIEEYLAEAAPIHQTSYSSTTLPTKDAVPASVRRCRKLDIMARDLAEGSNWYEIESTNSGQEFRWSGPKNRNTIKLPLNRSRNLLAKVIIVAIIDPAYANDIGVFVDGVGIEYVLFDNGETIRLQFVIPATASSGSEFTDVVLQIPSAHSPIEMGKGEDYRKLGMAVAGLTVRRKWPDIVEKIIERLCEKS